MLQGRTSISRSGWATRGPWATTRTQSTPASTWRAAERGSAAGTFHHPNGFEPAVPTGRIVVPRWIADALAEGGLSAARGTGPRAVGQLPRRTARELCPVGLAGSPRRYGCVVTTLIALWRTWTDHLRRRPEGAGRRALDPAGVTQVVAIPDPPTSRPADRARSGDASCIELPTRSSRRRESQVWGRSRADLRSACPSVLAASPRATCLGPGQSHSGGLRPPEPLWRSSGRLQSRSAESRSRRGHEPRSPSGLRSRCLRGTGQPPGRARRKSSTGLARVPPRPRRPRVQPAALARRGSPPPADVRPSSLPRQGPSRGRRP